MKLSSKYRKIKTQKPVGCLHTKEYTLRNHLCKILSNLCVYTCIFA